MVEPPLVDLSLAKAAIDAGNDDAFARAVAPLGIELALAALRAYVARFEPLYAAAVSFVATQAIAIAVREPAGYGLLHWARLTVLAVATPEQLVLGLQPAPPSDPFPAGGWAMGRWRADPSQNRAAAQAWAAAPARAGDALRAARAADGESGDDPDGEALRREVVARPDDDDVRLVYADWLVGRGDVRGELIQVQCELARGGSDRERRRALRRRESELLRANRATLQALEPRAERIQIERGLVSELSVFAAQLERHGAALLEAHPLRGLRVLLAGPKETARLFDSPVLAQIPELTIEARRSPRTPPSPARLALAGLARSAIFARTRVLRLEHLDDDDADWTAFFAGLRAPALEALTLRAARISPAALAGLATAPGLPALRRLELDGLAAARADGGTEGELEALASALATLAARPIEELALGAFRLDDAALARCLEAIGRRAAPRGLSLAHCSPGPAALGALGALPLRRLELVGLGLDEGGGEALLACLRRLEGLRELVLEDLAGPPALHAAVGHALLAAPSLARVRWQENRLDDDLAERLAERLVLLD